MKISEESSFLIDQCVKNVISRYSNVPENVVTDIHFQPSLSTGELLVFNDEDEELSRVIIEEWAGVEEQEAMPVIESALRTQLEHHRKQLEELSILKPYSFVLVDMDKETIEDLMLVDDELILASDGLLQGLDKELDDFLKELLEEK